jgi:hypothetical protein
MTDSHFWSLEGRVEILEDKLNTLSALVEKFGLLAPDMVELKSSVAKLTLALDGDSARNALLAHLEPSNSVEPAPVVPDQSAGT